LKSQDYPYPELFKLLYETNFKGWILLEASSTPNDKIAAIKEQLSVFNKLIVGTK